MKKEEADRLKYRNQYLLTPSSIECPFLHNRYNVGKKYVLYTHKDLVMNSVEQEDVKLILLGDLFDYISPEKNNEEILKDLIHYEFDSLLEAIGNYTGRYVIIHLNGDKLNLVHDPIASRKIYFCNSQNDVWVASQPHLLAKVLGFGKTSKPELLDYYSSQEFVRLNNANIGNITLYDEISQLLPNHFLDFDEMKVIRFWPKIKNERRSLKEVTLLSAKMIRGFMESISSRYEVMLPLTAGKDSRLLLAASKQFKEKVYYYINKSVNLTDNHADISVPKRLLADLNLNFDIQIPSSEVDDEFKKIYYYNNEYASTEFLPIIYNYYVKFRNKVNLPGNIATGGLEFYKSKRIKNTGSKLAQLNHVDHYLFANDYYDNWITERLYIFQNLEFEMIDLFYWEERLANWGTQIQTEKDIAQEEINLFNSRNLIALFLSVNPKYIATPFFKLHKGIIRLLWPDVLKIPFNPGFHTSLKKTLKPIGILDAYYRLKNL
jgi:asparagine synthetase B (glutamine-hydrolysing)